MKKQLLFSIFLIAIVFCMPPLQSEAEAVAVATAETAAAVTAVTSADLEPARAGTRDGITDEFLEFLAIKKAEAQKEANRKTEAQKEADRKSEAKKESDRKSEAKKAAESKSEAKKAADRKSSKRRTANKTAARDSSGGYKFALENGKMCVYGTDNSEIWRTGDAWYVDSFRLGDVNRDGVLDVAFVVWKSYSFGANHPARMENDDPTVRCHLFLYSIKDDRVKSLWCSSNLPHPIYSFDLNDDGEQTPTLSGTLLITREGSYTDDFSKTASAEYVYAWSSWGFSPLMAPSGAAEDTRFDPRLASYTANLAVVGDLMCHEAQNRDALSKGGGETYDYNYSFKYIAPYISAADYAIGNLETTIIWEGGRPSGFPAFGAPSTYAEAVKNAGFDLVSTANNHALDFRGDGIERTLRVLDELGLEHTGTYVTEADSREIKLVDVNNITFAILSYTYGTNGIPTPRDMPWCVNKYDKIIGDIARAKELDPDVIIVMPHLGNEYETATRHIYKEEIFSLLEAGADLVLASHPHVLQPAEFVTVTGADGAERKCFVAYSMGNFISSQRTPPRDYGMIVNLSFKKAVGGGKAELDSVRLTPVWVKYTSPDGGFDITVLPVNELDIPEFAEVASGLSRADVLRIEAVKAEFTEMYAELAAG